MPGHLQAGVCPEEEELARHTRGGELLQHQPAATMVGVRLLSLAVFAYVPTLVETAGTRRCGFLGASYIAAYSGFGLKTSSD
jgi:hypothetical protein